eukprot:5564148-Alexandrium_andersonii.AAC.1
MLACARSLVRVCVSHCLFPASHRVPPCSLRCAGSAECGRAEDFAITAGSLTIVGPAPLTQDSGGQPKTKRELL